MNEITTNNTISMSNVISQAVSSGMEGFVSRYMLFANKSAENILEMSKVVFEASKAFGEEPFEQFCSTVGLRDKCTVSKMKKIGSRYAQLAPFMNRLPPAWTTLYTLAKLSDEKFEEIVSANKVSIYTTAKQLGEILPSKKRGSRIAKSNDGGAQQPANDFVFKLKTDTAIEGDKKRELQAKLATLCNEYGVQLIAA
jgi:hypothetical protein